MLNLAAQGSAALSLPVAGLAGATSAVVKNQGGRAATWAAGTLGDTAFGPYELRVYVIK